MNNFRTNARCRNARYIPAIERRTEVKSVFLNDAVDGAHNGAPIRLALRVSGSECWRQTGLRGWPMNVQVSDRTK